MALTYLALASFRRGDIDDFLCTGTVTLDKLGILAAGVELRHSVVIPEDAIAFARDEHGDGDLGVHLRQPARESTHVAIAILKLSQSEEVFILR